MKQRTIKRKISTEGIGIHTGTFAKLSLLPAPPDNGIVFLKNGVRIKADIINSESNHGSTILKKDGESVNTVEHILAAFYGTGVNNCICEITGDEIPALDGSALGFVELIKDAEIIELDKEREIKNIRQTVEYRDEKREIIALPNKNLRISFYIDYERDYPPPQFKSFTITPEVFEKEIAPARTHTFYRWIEEIWKRGLGKGGSLDNVLVIGENGLINQTSLRFPDEFVRHKILDLIGDLSLLGCHINANIFAFKSGHVANINFTKLLKSQLEVTVFDIKDIQNILPHRYPMLLVDRIVELTDEKVVGIKNVTINEPFFQGHFPGHPIMPGVLIVESLAQVGGFLMLKKVDEPKKYVVYFLKIDKVKFRKPVFPGDTLRNELKLIKHKEGLFIMQGKAYINDVVVCEGEFTAKVVKK
ncbi:UDP-3-O-[3-hydroxymyristoyl] N-acetylglucosamine deacetylase [candidate division WOR-3 bacterium]|nr:UDP-3-O-[3-hydroxymyristoyl] N-acetylglucosamine deacetylase [candidate division WOR-3 bacterium]